jgi:ribosomal protein S4E
VVLLSGVTSLRQHIRPDLVISLSAREVQQNWQPVKSEMALVPGAQVRVCGGEHEGAVGTIDHLFTHQQVFSSGVRARAARIKLEDDTSLVLPLPLIERIG